MSFHRHAERRRRALRLYIVDTFQLTTPFLATI